MVIENSSTNTAKNATAIESASANSSEVAFGHNVTAPTASTLIGVNANVPLGSQATVIGHSAQTKNSGVGIGSNKSNNGNNRFTIGQDTASGGDSTPIGVVVGPLSIQH